MGHPIISGGPLIYNLSAEEQLMVEHKKVTASVDIYDENGNLISQYDFEHLSEAAAYIMQMPRSWYPEVHFYNVTLQ